MTTARRTRRRSITLLTPSDPSNYEGGTLILSDCRVHFGPRFGAVICIEREGAPGYEIVATGYQDHEVVQRWQEGLEVVPRTWRMTNTEHAAWCRAAAAVGRDMEPQTWTATLDGDPDIAEVEATAETPAAAVAALDKLTAQYGLSSTPLAVGEDGSKLVVMDGTADVGRIFPS